MADLSHSSPDSDSRAQHKTGDPTHPRPAFSDGGDLEIPPGAPRTLVEALLTVANREPERGIRFLSSPTSGLHLTYRDLLRRALRIGHGLRAAGIEPGERVVLQIEHLPDHYASFWACLLGGVAPVTVATPPDYLEPNSVTAKLIAAWQQLGRPWVLAGDSTAGALRDLAARRGLEKFQVLSVDRLQEAPAARKFDLGKPEDVAFFQLTSGTTGVPKCIQITHAGVVAHVHGSLQADRRADDDVLLNWLARDHVVPLLTSHIKGVYLGLEQVELPTEIVLAEPLAWLEAIAHHRVTHTWSPNFGYMLVADRLERCRGRDWDLSCVKAFMNAGEQVTLPVVRAFLDAVARFGVSERAMQPAFGMAEACTCMTYETRFDWRDSVLWLRGDRMVSRGGDAPPGERSIPVVNLGPPTPGVQIRITDEQNHVIPEGIVGRLQIKGRVVTPGYYNNPAANASALVGDGWFNTGDLGLIHRGELAITGREKQRIVIFGANYHSHEIENAVQSIEGIKPGYIAACAVPDPDSGSDSLAVFFSPSVWTEEPSSALVDAIHRKVAAEIGLSARHIIPVQLAAFPRTTSGKIQRARLVASLEAGDFRAIQEKLERRPRLRASSTGPFHRTVWREKNIDISSSPEAQPLANACCIILGRAGPLERELQENLSRRGFVIVLVQPAASFGDDGDGRYEVNPGSAHDFGRLFSALRDAGLTVHSIVHLWTHAGRWNSHAGLRGLEHSQATGTASLLALAQAFNRESSSAPVSLTIVSSGLFSVTPEDVIAAEKTPLIGLAETVRLEFPWMSCRVIDLPLGESDVCARVVCDDIFAASKARSVAYRKGRRFVPHVEPVEWSEHTARPLPFRARGAYVITGGLGGIGRELALHLLREHRARLLLLGHTPLPDRSQWKARDQLSPEVAERIAALLELEQHGGEVRYEPLDICDLSAVSQAVARAEAAWGYRIEGAVHLAGRYREQLLTDETWEDVWGLIRVKLGGAWVLDQIVRGRPGSFLVLFSSIFGSFSSAVMLGAYAASNSAVEGLAAALRATSERKVWCFTWSNWAGTGMSRLISADEGRALRGFLPLTPVTGIQSLMAGLCHDVPDLLVGMAGPDESPNDADSDAARPVGSATSMVAPRTDLQRCVSGIWREVLGLSSLGIHDEFRALGGSSLQALQIAGRLRSMFSLEIPVRRLLTEGSTVAKVADLLQELRMPDGNDATKPTASLSAPAIPSQRAEEPALPSFAQERMWFLARLDPDDPAYHVPLVVRIVGPLQPARLRETLQQIVRRHESLRTAFVEEDGRPRLSIAPECSLEIEELGPEELGNEADLDRLIVERTRQPFDLTKPPLVRAVLVRLDPDRHVLVWVWHHIICDERSTAILLQEMAEIHAALRAGRNASLPVPPIPYSEYARRQREACQGARLDRTVQYWREQLSGEPSLLELPTDRPRPPVRTTRGGEIVSMLDADLMAAIERASTRQEVTLFTTLLAAFNVLLHRLTQQTDLTVGVPYSGRSYVGTDGMIGLFINTLPIRVRFEADATFDQLVARTRDALYGGLDHADVPLDRIVAELPLARHPDRSPLFDVMFNLHSGTTSPVALDDCAIDIETPGNGAAKFDLAVTLQPRAGGHRAIWEYNRDLFDEDRVRRWSGHFETLLRNLVADSGLRIGAAPLLREPERQQLLVDFNAGSEPGRDGALHQLFEQQVRRTPNAIALVCGDQRLTYDDLNRRANRLARHLSHGQALAPETLVAVCLERSVDLIVALIAVLKAGGAYLPLDPNYPEDRLRFMLADSGASVVLTNAHLAARLDVDRVRRTLLDAEALAIAQEHDADLDLPVASGQPAYVLYTSGSTGRPKGVVIEHAGPVALVDWAWRTFSAAQLEGVLASTSVCFDLSVFEIFVPLAGGGKVILVRDLLHFPEAPASAEVAFVNTVPSAMEELLRLGELPPVRVIGLAGEPLSARLAERCAQLPGTPQVWNLYGPTEDTVYSTAARMVAPIETPPSIGQPIAGSRAYILEPSGEPVPIGVPGELYLGGRKLARGYLNRPELNRERFLPDPFSHDAGARLYRTGDRARWRPDGAIELLGRLDHQVKLRGFRIELSEIESVLNEHPTVRESVVIAAGEGGARQLLAYVAMKPGDSAADDDLRQHLAPRLPAYMIPSRFVRLEALPRTANGKLDRRALPEPERPSPAVGPNAAGSMSETEVRVAKIFREILGVDAVASDAHFFELGGHSLLATRLVARLRQELGVPISLRRVFDEPTVAGLARSLDEQATEPSAPPRQQESFRVPALSYAQEGLWLFHQLQPATALFHLGYRFALRGAVDVEALQASFDELLRRHDALRTGFVVRDSRPEAIIDPECRLLLRRVELNTAPPENRERSVDAAARNFVREPFDLTRPPLMRALLLRVTADDHVLVVATHHIVFDGWSRTILNQELAALYEAFRAKKTCSLTPLRMQCADFARRQRRMLEGDRRARLIDQWKSQLQGAPILLDLPLDRPRPPRQEHSGRHESLMIDAPLATALREIGRAWEATPFMVLLTAFATVLARWSGQEDMLIGVPLAGRDDPDLHPLIGMFVNVMPVRVDLRAGPTFVEALRKVRVEALETYEHQDLPLELLLRELKIERRADVAPLFQVALNYQSVSRNPGSAESALRAETDVDIESSRFDLTLYVRDDGETLQLRLAYDRNLFRPDTVRRLLNRLRTLLPAVICQPHRRVSSLPLLTEGEREWLRSQRNSIAPRQDFVPFFDAEIEQSIGDRFRQQVARHGERRALACVDGDWTYARLHAEALRIAATIMAAGANGARVALVFEPGGRMMAAILGSLLGGAAWVPLDPRHPPARLRIIVEDCSPSVILTSFDCRSAADAIATTNCPVLVVDELPTAAEDVALPEVGPDDLAYVIYTSGSTGEPKGVMQNHRNVLHHMRAYTNALHLNDGDRIAMLAPYTSDLAVMDLFGALLNGATLVPIDLRDSVESEIARRLDDERISVLHLTPTVYRWLLGTVADGRVFPSVRMVVLGGEAARARDLELYRRHFGPDCLLVNGLGPTESTLALQCFFNHDGPACGRRVPVGYPVQNTEILLLDEAGEPADLLGEIAIKSRHVALGYWRHPDLTQAAFIEPANGDGCRIYRTGDRGRMRDDGRIEFLGRKDEQVKIRGLRVEPGEIEGMLARHPAVREAVVVACEEPGAETWLAAHVVPRPGREQVTERELLADLESCLPAHMVPAVIVFTKQLPRTRTDKVDRRALPRPERRWRKLARQVIAPRNPIEQEVAALWDEILRTGPISVQDSFLELGGDSLQAMRLLSRLHSVTQVEISLNDFFRQPTVEALAQRIEAARRDQTELESTVI